MEDGKKVWAKEELKAQLKKEAYEMMKLKKQLSAEREAEDEKLSKMTKEERVAYLWARNQKLYKETEGKFQNTVELTTKDKKGDEQ